MAEEDGLLTFLDGEADIVEKYGSIWINGLQTLYFKNLCARLTLHREDDTRIFTR